MEKILIKRYDTEIEKDLEEVKTIVAIVNNGIDRIVKLGVIIPGNLLPDIARGVSSRIIEEAKQQVNEEIDHTKSRFAFLSKVVDLSPLEYDIETAVDVVERQLRQYNNGLRRYISYKDGHAVVSSSAKDELTERYSIYIDSPKKEKAWQLINKAKTVLENLEEFLNANTEFIHAAESYGGPWNMHAALQIEETTEKTWNIKAVPDVLRYID